MYTGFKVMKDCFAYDRVRHKCRALDDLYCCKEEHCSFYKNSRRSESKKRLRSFDKTRETLSGKVFH